jgi:hypothetical protein
MGRNHAQARGELAGMVAHCDFFEQESITVDGGRLRPIWLCNCRAAGRSSWMPRPFWPAIWTHMKPRPRNCVSKACAVMPHKSGRDGRVEPESLLESVCAGAEFVVLFLPANSSLALRSSTIHGSLRMDSFEVWSLPLPQRSWRSYGQSAMGGGRSN